ncbi:MAG: hypothetical protein KDK48_05255, partial [Chlamydiia bacterium]|nr:hypothetical protein [Chlamydiia bacterium]
MTIVDRNGLTETVSSSDRLAGYDKVDFLTNHPYSEVVRVYKRDALGNVHSVATTYHENGQPHQMLEITNGRACGRYLQWFENGQLALSGTVLEGNAELTDAAAQSWKFDGECLSWNKEGNLVARIGYSKGYLDGKSTYFHCNGTIWKEVCFVAGLPEGEAVTRYQNGELLESVFFSQGMRHGTLTRYWECGKLAAREEYCLGKLQSGEYFHPNQATACSVVQGFGWKAVCAKDFIVELRQVQDGQQEGEVKVFTPGGGLIQVYHVKNGLKNGEDIEYYAEAPGRIPKIKVLWVDGTIQGTVATWYP